MVLIVTTIWLHVIDKKIYLYLYSFLLILAILLILIAHHVPLQDIEATIHCAEWLSMIGGTTTGDQRVRYFCKIVILTSNLVNYL